jgi:hypothetical protein
LQKGQGAGRRLKRQVRLALVFFLKVRYTEKCQAAEAEGDLPNRKGEDQMAYSVKVAEAVRTFLDADHWNYQFQEETGVFQFIVTLDSKLKQAGFIIRTEETGYTLRAVCALGAKDCLPRMAEFLHRAN